jgi:hypothetical protein
MILNKILGTEYDCLWTSGFIERRKKIYQEGRFPSNWLDYVDIPDEQIYYVEFMGIDTFQTYKLEDYIPDIFINKIRNENVKLMLHCTGHGYHEIVEEIYLNVVVRDKVPISNIIVSSESFDLNVAADYVSKKYNVPPFRLRVTLEFEAYGTHYAKNLSGFHFQNGEKLIQNSFIKNNYTKKFTSLNGYYREHRAAIVFFLACFDLLDKGFVSYNIKESGAVDTGENVYNHLMYCMWNCPEALELLEKNKEKLFPIQHILLDTDYNQTQKNLAEIQLEHNTYFNQSYFTILTETNFPFMRYPTCDFNEGVLWNNVGRLYSEKIFRCMVYKHPFIATGPKDFLKVLHKLGYKTFNGIIDESYDDEPNDSKRLYLIAQEAKRLCNLNDNELDDFLSKAKVICDHNFEILKSRKQFAFDLPFII